MSSFGLVKNVSADTYEAPVFDVPLTFTGPYTVSVVAKMQNFGKVWFLQVPDFVNAAVNVSNVFTATLPSSFPPAPLAAGVGTAVYNANSVAAGFVSIQGSTLIVRNFTGNFTTQCGLALNTTLSYITTN